MDEIGRPEDYLSDFHLHFYENTNKINLDQEKGWKRHYLELMIKFKEVYSRGLAASVTSADTESECSVSEITSVPLMAPGFLQYLNKKSGATGVVMSLKDKDYIAARKNKIRRWVPFPLELTNDGILEPINDNASVYGLLTTMNERFTRINTKSGPIYGYTFMRQSLVPYYRHPKLDSWRKMPLTAEISIPKMKEKIQEVKNVIGFSDQLEIMATLRTCNYDVEDCINTLQSALDLQILDFKELLGADRKKGELQVSWVEVLNVLQTLKFDNKNLIETNKKLEVELKKIKETQKSERDNWSETMKAIEYPDQRRSMLGPCIPNDKKSTDKKTGGIFHRNKQSSVKPPKQAKVSGSLSGRYTNLKLGLGLIKNLSALIKLDLKNFQTFLDIHAKNIKGTMQKCSTLFAQNSEVEYLRTRCREEEMKRKLLFNQMQELFGNIRVFCRLRPPPKPEELAVRSLEDDTVSVKIGSVTHEYTFTRVFNTNASQEEVFSEVEPLILSCVDGYNVCLMAYGQTGSGKTHTMVGTPQQPGVNPRAIGRLIKEIHSRNNWLFSMKISIVEVYKEQVNDLLSKTEEVVKISIVNNEVTLVNVTETDVKTERDVENVIKTSDAKRKVCQTKMNSQSSRSHLILIIRLLGENKIHKTRLTSKLALCDLAGSEDISKSKVEGNALKEAIQINMSLSVLSRVFYGLCTKQSSIPFRDSKLTHILKPYLSDDAKCAVFLNVRSDIANAPETKRTIMFGESAAKITMGKAKRHVVQA